MADKFCTNCGADLFMPGKFCGKCGTEIILPSSSLSTSSPSTSASLPSTSSSLPSTSSSSPLTSSSLNSINKDGKKSKTGIKSFSEYKKLKGSEWNKKVKAKPVDKAEDVVIYIGLMQWKKEECKLKPTRGKRVALKISNEAPYADVREKGIEKWKAYHSNEFIIDEEYSLTYQDGQEALFLPGTKEFFSAKRYREESGKDYKRITLYLCSKDDLRRNENHSLNSSETEDECEQPAEKKSKSQVERDELIAKELQYRFNNESCGDDTVNISDDQEVLLITTEDEVSMQLPNENYKSSEVLSNDGNGNADPKLVSKETKIYQNITDLVENLAGQVDQSDQFFFVVRRGAKLQRQLTIWQREARKKSPKHRVMVRFAGESGIDNGALAKEFFTSIVNDIGKNIFPGGSPQDSMLNVHNGTFCTCGEIVANSIAQGGPPPCFLEECVYNMLVDGDVDINTLVPETHLTTLEQEVLESIKNDPTAMSDVILDHGYTGKVNNDHIDDIVGTVTVSLISKRLSYLKEFKKGLNLFGLPALIQENSLLCKQLFVTGHGGKAPDANYVVSCLIPCYSEVGSSRRVVEEEILDHFQDLLISLEDDRVTGYTEDLAWNDGDDSLPNAEDKDERGSCQAPDLTPAGVLKWLTGQKHVPINGENLKIQVYFDHDCITRNNMHTICFPVVGSCACDITLPVQHMKGDEDFKRVFLLGFCKSQSFGRA